VSHLPLVRAGAAAALVLAATAAAAAAEGPPAWLEALKDGPAAPEALRATIARVYWSSVEDSADPADLDRFLALVRDERLAALARARRERLLSAGATPVRLVAPRAADPPPPPGSVEGATPCDAAAARPGDTRRLSAGVPVPALDVGAALRACSEAAAARAEEPRLLYQLGRALDVAGRLADARQLYEAAAAADHPAALLALGHMHRVGRGTDPDPARAAALVRRAADLGSPPARTALGWMYLRGAGVPRSPEQALRWTRLAADDGWMGAVDQLGNLHRLGEGVPRDARVAFELHLKAAGLGSTNAMNRLGRMLRDGDGVPRDVPAGVAWLERASAAGNAYAARELGQVWRRGTGAARDPARALASYRLAAARGFVEAYADIAAMHEAGDGVPADPAEAYFFYRLALEGGLRRERSFTCEPAREGSARLGALLPPGRRAALDERASAHLESAGPVPPLDTV
jgi:TPR repeat protein